MKTLTKVFFTLLPIAFGACGSDGDPTNVNRGIDRSDLQYKWMATKAEFTSNAQPSTKRDIITFGGELTLDLRAARYEMTWDNGTDPVTHISNFSAYYGDWSVANNRLTLTAWDDMSFTIALSGNTLTLAGGPCEYDFDGDWEDDQATLTMVLVRQ